MDSSNRSHSGDASTGEAKQETGESYYGMRVRQRVRWCSYLKCHFDSTCEDSNGSPDLLLSTLLTMWKEEGIRRRLWENVCRKANWQ